MEVFTLQLKLNDLQYIINILSTLPWKDSNPILVDIQKQIKAKEDE